MPLEVMLEKAPGQDLIHTRAECCSSDMMSSGPIFLLLLSPFRKISNMKHTLSCISYHETKSEAFEQVIIELEICEVMYLERVGLASWVPLCCNWSQPRPNNFNAHYHAFAILVFRVSQHQSCSLLYPLNHELSFKKNGFM